LTSTTHRMISVRFDEADPEPLCPRTTL